jgi:outer membrane lipoprotein SlyB
MNEGEKLKSTISEAPLGALGGAIFGYLLAKKVGYEKTISVISFTMVGLIVGSFIGSTIKSKKLA